MTDWEVVLPITGQITVKVEVENDADVFAAAEAQAWIAIEADGMAALDNYEVVSRVHVGGGIWLVDAPHTAWGVDDAGNEVYPPEDY